MAPSQSGDASIFAQPNQPIYVILCSCCKSINDNVCTL